MISRSYELPRRVVDLLNNLKDQGVSKQGVVRCAVYWYVHRLSPAEQTQAQRETAAWVETGQVSLAATESPEADRPDTMPSAAELSTRVQVPFAEAPKTQKSKQPKRKANSG